MPDANYYRKQATVARKLAERVRAKDIRQLLRRVAREYDEVAEDVERGVARVRHRDLVPTG